MKNSLFLAVFFTVLVLGMCFGVMNKVMTPNQQFSIVFAMILIGGMALLFWYFAYQDIKED